MDITLHVYMWMTEGVQQVQPSAGFQPCSENGLEWERSYFINIRVLNKNSSNEGFLVKLLSGFRFCCFHLTGWWVPCPVLIRPSASVWVDRKLSVDLTKATCCLFLALALIVNTAGTWCWTAVQYVRQEQSTPSAL